MDMHIFREIGLTDGETKVYLSLLRLGETKTGPLAREAKVSLSKVYKILDKLMEKGLAGFVIKGKVRHYTAMEPKRVLDYLENRKSELEEKTRLVKDIIPRLETERLRSPNKPQAAVYEGFKAVTNLFRNIVDDLNKGETYYVMGAYYGSLPADESKDVPGLRAFFEAHHKRRAKKGVRVKMLANHDLKGKMVLSVSLKSEIRYLPHYLMTNMTIVFYKNKTSIVIFNKIPVGFLIEGKETVESFSKYFDAFWKIAKK